MSVVLDLVGIGGAELLLLNLFRTLDPTIVTPRLVCLREAGPLAGEFRSAGFAVEVIGRAGRFRRLVQVLRADATDVVLVTHHHKAALTLGRVAARLARVPATVVAAHDMDLTSVGQRCLPRHDVASLFLADALVLLAPSQGRYLHEEEGVGRFPWSTVAEVVIPNGIPLPAPVTAAQRSTARTALRLAPADVAVGIIARLVPQKAHHVLISAVALLLPTHPELRLVVIGGGECGPSLRAQVRELGMGDRVVFAGSRPDVSVLLPGLDISCLSSVHEGAPLAVIESMAASLPVVVTDCGALRDMVTDGEEALFAAVGDVVALAERIGRLASDVALRADMGARGRLRAEREGDIASTAARYEELLVSLVARRPRAGDLRSRGAGSLDQVGRLGTRRRNRRQSPSRARR